MLFQGAKVTIRHGPPAMAELAKESIEMPLMIIHKKDTLTNGESSLLSLNLFLLVHVKPCSPHFISTYPITIQLNRKLHGECPLRHTVTCIQWEEAGHTIRRKTNRKPLPPAI
ncbi:hypothetical protein BDA99DRAFT_537708 [Phascolomyces articulosus]|uniref:Uncharacterized protein n=1 Tax=Phascolomyces articulosus TaxID=60185 RepID=A0AAD5K065_9FUNG|nr:hypothetical protein BDA99DRAFT_537708 [Phascolomyces articulosus]